MIKRNYHDREQHTATPRTVCIIAVAGLVSVTAVPSRADDDRPLLLKARTVYAAPDQAIENGAVLVEDGRIQAVGTNIDAPDDAVIIERADGVITAGLIDANCPAGYVGRFSPAEHRSEVVPELRVIDGVDLASRDFDRLAAAGVTTVYVSADPASIIGGQGAILQTAGPDDGRVVRDAYGIKATIGREPIFRTSANRGPFGNVTYLTRRPTTRMGLVWVFRKAFHDARAFKTGHAPATRGEGSPSDASIPYLQKVLDGEIPLRIQARAQHDITTALRLADEFNLSFILEEATDANRCIDELRRRKVPIVFGPLFDYPSGFRAATGEAQEYRYSTPSVLLEAEIPTAISAGEAFRNAPLPDQAAAAMRFGLTRAQALAAVTTTPASMLAIGDRAGTVEKDRPADLVLWSGQPLDATTRAEVVIIGGRIVKDARGERDSKENTGREKPDDDAGEPGEAHD